MKGGPVNPQSLMAALLVLGIAAVLTGAVLISWPAGLLAAGVLALVALADLRR